MKHIKNINCFICCNIGEIYGFTKRIKVWNNRQYTYSTIVPTANKMRLEVTHGATDLISLEYYLLVSIDV